MRSVATKTMCLVLLLGISGSAQGTPTARRRQQGSTRRSEARFSRRRRRRAQHGAGDERAEARGLLRSHGSARHADSARDRGAGAVGREAWREAGRKPADKPAASNQGPPGLNFSNSDIAFRRNDLFLGNFNGFNAYDIDPSKKAKLVASIVCPGGQGDMSVHGNLLFMSVEQTRGRLDCGTQGVEAPSVPTVSAACGSSTSATSGNRSRSPTCRPAAARIRTRSSIDPKDHENVYVYGSGTSTVRAGEELAGCSNLEPKEDPNTALFSIDVIQVPLAAPDKARIVNRPRIFADPASGAISGLWPGGDHGPGTQKTQRHQPVPRHHRVPGGRPRRRRVLGQRHPARHLRPGAPGTARSGRRQELRLLAFGDVQQRRHQGDLHRRVGRRHAPAMPRDRSAELGRRRHLRHRRSQAPFRAATTRCRRRRPSRRTASRTTARSSRFLDATSWCRRGTKAASRYSTSRIPRSRSRSRTSIAVRSTPANLILGGFWSAYWYNGRIYGSEIARGLDVFTLTPSEYLSQDEIDAASAVHLDEFNAQLQPTSEWPATPVVARAYLAPADAKQGGPGRPCGRDQGRAGSPRQGQAQATRRSTGTVRQRAPPGRTPRGFGPWRPRSRGVACP